MKRLVIGLIVLGCGLGAMFAYTSAAREREYWRLIAQGDTALGFDQTFVAIEAFSGAIALKGDSMLAHLKRGETYRRRGDAVAALRDLRTAARLDPTATRPIEQLGDLSYEIGRYSRAAEYYAEYTRLDDRSSRVLYKLGLARYREGQGVAAIPPLRQAVTLDEKFGEGYYLLGLCLREQTQFEEAREALRRAIEVMPSMIAAREELADLEQLQDRLPQQIDQLETLAMLDPLRADRQVTLALAYARAGRVDQAVATLRRAAEQYPEEPQIYVALGRVWLDAAAHGDRVALNKAMEALQAAIGAGSSEALTLMGEALLLGRDASRAERMLRQATTRFPVDYGAFLLLADAAERRGHARIARDALLHYRVLLPDAGDTKTRPGALAARIGTLSLQIGDSKSAIQWLQRALDEQGQDPRVTMNPAILALQRRLR